MYTIEIKSTVSQCLCSVTKSNELTCNDKSKLLLRKDKSLTCILGHCY